MKKSLIALLAFAAASSAMAASTNPLAVTSDVPSEVKSPYNYELGISTHREVYEEFVDSALVMREEAVMSTLKAGVSRAVGSHGGKVALKGEFGIGNADYTGSYMSGQYGDLRVSDLHRSLFDLNVAYVQAAPLWNGLAAGVGLGYRRLVDNLQDGGPGGYKRVNERTYLTLSLDQAISFANWSVTPGVQYKYILSSKQKSDLPGGVKVNQPDGHGAEASVAIARKAAGYSLVITPFIRTWDVRDSEVHPTGLYEPRNKTKEVGVAVTYQF